MKQSEKKIERRLVNKVKELGGLCIKLLPFQMSGLPDRMCLIPMGIIVFVETKSTGDKPSRIQEIVHSKIRKIGFEVLVIDSTQQVDNFINRYAK